MTRSAIAWCSLPTSITCEPACHSPSADSYDDVDLHEDGIGMAVTFGREFRGETAEATSTASGFFSWVEGAPAEGYRALPHR